VRAQQGDGVRRIGVLTPSDENDPVVKSDFAAFTQALAGLGWTDGRNVRIDLRSYRADINRIQALAQELVRLQPDIILTDATAATVALQRETRTIPIVFATVSDPLASGIVARLDRPSGNITGFASLEATLGGKWLERHAVVADDPRCDARWHPWLDVFCPGCGTSRALDLRTLDRHPLASIGTLVLGLRCSCCPGSAPMPKLLGLSALPPARRAAASESA
jgi:hypothetical protein